MTKKYPKKYFMLNHKNVKTLGLGSRPYIFGIMTQKIRTILILYWDTIMDEISDPEKDGISIPDQFDNHHIHLNKRELLTSIEDARLIPLDRYQSIGEYTDQGIGYDIVSVIIQKLITKVSLNQDVRYKLCSIATALKEESS